MLIALTLAGQENCKKLHGLKLYTESVSSLDITCRARTLTPVHMNFIQAVVRFCQHPHVRAKLFRQSLNDVTSERRARHSHTLGGVLCIVGRVLVVESDHSVELGILNIFLYHF